VGHDHLVAELVERVHALGVPRLPMMISQRRSQAPQNIC